MTDLVRLEATVRGRVQGVGFRYWVVREARHLGIAGWVANAADGTVRAVAEGSEDEIDRIEQILRDGPPGALVDDISTVRMPGTGAFESFVVRSSGHSGD